MQNSFDYVVIGGGSAGCVMAGRLSEDPDVTLFLQSLVLVIFIRVQTNKPTQTTFDSVRG